MGMIWAFEVDDTEPDFAKRFYLTGLAQELLLRPIGNTVYFMQPYIISEDEMILLVGRTLSMINGL